MNEERPEFSDKSLGFFTEVYRQYPNHVKGLGWSSSRSQQKRFKVLIAGIKQRSPEDSILDVGCGYADLSQQIKWTPHYCGIDLNPQVIQVAKIRYPDLDLRVADIFDEQRKFDWVLASGVFSVKVDNNNQVLRAGISKMWDLSKKGIAFNILVTGSDIKNDQVYFYDPGEVLNYCRSLALSVVCRMDYLPHDATFCLYR